jgi:hypothetical protein
MHHLISACVVMFVVAIWGAIGLGFIANEVFNALIEDEA